MYLRDGTRIPEQSTMTTTQENGSEPQLECAKDVYSPPPSSTVSVGGRTITNLRFAEDIDGLAGQEQELVKLVNQPEEVSTAYSTHFNAERTQLMTDSTNGISTDITIDNKKLETACSFKYREL